MATKFNPGDRVLFVNRGVQRAGTVIDHPSKWLAAVLPDPSNGHDEIYEWVRTEDIQGLVPAPSAEVASA